MTATTGMSFRTMACGAAALVLTVFTAFSIAQPTQGYTAGLRAGMTPVVTVEMEHAATRVAQAAMSVLLD